MRLSQWSVYWIWGHHPCKGYPFDSLELYDLELVRPKFPFRQTPICTKGYAFEPYDYNGWVYELEPGNYCVVFNTTPMIPVSFGQFNKYRSFYFSNHRTKCNRPISYYEPVDLDWKCSKLNNWLKKIKSSFKTYE